MCTEKVNFCFTRVTVLTTAVSFLELHYVALFAWYLLLAFSFGTKSFHLHLWCVFLWKKRLCIFKSELISGKKHDVNSSTGGTWIMLKVWMKWGTQWCLTADAGRSLNSNPSSATDLLCVLRQVASPLWASVYLHVDWRKPDSVVAEVPVLTDGNSRVHRGPQI